MLSFIWISKYSKAVYMQTGKLLFNVLYSKVPKFVDLLVNFGVISIDVHVSVVRLWIQYGTFIDSWLSKCFFLPNLFSFGNLFYVGNSPCNSFNFGKFRDREFGGLIESTRIFARVWFITEEFSLILGEPYAIFKTIFN